AGAAIALGALRAEPERLLAALGFAALTPLALGSVILTRFDLWPTALLVLGLAAVLAEHRRTGLGVLGLAAAAKIFPVVVVPPALVYVWRRHGRREALLCAAVFAGVVAIIFLPFVRLSPGGVWYSLHRQADRPLPLVPLVRGRRGLAASAVLALALVLTQLWFPYRYWRLALHQDAIASWLVFARDLVLVALVLVLAIPRRGRARTT